VTVVDDTLKILVLQGTELDLDAVPLDDPETFRIFCDGRTNGIFQFESGGMKDMLRRAQPSRFEDLAAFNALYRPGALSVGMVDEFIQRKLGKKSVRYILPETKPILEETHGVIAYQEQVMQIAVAVASFTMGEADVLRKAMGKKDPQVMPSRSKFLTEPSAAWTAQSRRAVEPHRAVRRLRLQQTTAWPTPAGLQTAYLKAHYPVAFMAAMLSSEIASSDKSPSTFSSARWGSRSSCRTSTRATGRSPWSATPSASASERSRASASRRWKPSWRRADASAVSGICCTSPRRWRRGRSTARYSRA
jgi:DNA polymerase-3 subunit alpha